MFKQEAMARTQMMAMVGAFLGWQAHC